MKRRILITSALPYANGDIHLGHLVEHLITDYWSRFQKMRGHEILRICADDTHGAPIMIKARKLGITPEEQISQMQIRHQHDFRDFHIQYDHYSSTHTEINRKFCDYFYQRMQKNGHIEIRSVDQWYCEHDKMFLPDRFVNGTCPRCHAPGQNGDSCDVCGAVYAPTEIKDPQCAICQNTPVLKPSKHYFFLLSHFQDMLNQWVPNHTSSAVAKKLDEWLKDKLADWCFTRDEPYFGFAVPGSAEKYYYVWFDAPVGYIATTQEWCEQNQRSLEEFWKDPQCEIYHNIGKDIVYFHSLFWPAMLETADFQKPKEIFVHGMLTMNGEKLSKSKNTFINARSYLNHLDPNYLRYYMACKLNDSIADIDLSWDDFISRVNSDLIGKITNIASRCAQMLNKKLGGDLSTLDHEGQKLVESCQSKADLMAELFEKRQFSKAMIIIRELAELVNRYVDDHTPWKLIKTDPEQTRKILSAALNGFRIIAIFLKPIMPMYTEKVEKLFQEDQPYDWQAIKTIKTQTRLATFEHLLLRIDQDKVDAVINESSVPVEN